MESNEVRCTIKRSPDGWPSVGDFIESDGCLYRVMIRGSVIYYGLSGREDYIEAVAALVDWDSVPDGVDVSKSKIRVELTLSDIGDRIDRG